MEPCATKTASRPARRRWMMLAALCAAMLGMLVPAGADEYSEEEVKAAFVFKFAKFVEWPEPDVNAEVPASKKESVPSTFKIGVLGDRRFADALSKMASGQKIRNCDIEIVQASSIETLQDCQVLFIGATEQERAEKPIAGMSRQCILTIGDGADFLNKGGMIALDKVESRFQFRVNLSAANRARLQLSSQLLKLAKDVIKDEEVDSGKDEGNSPPTEE